MEKEPAAKQEWGIFNCLLPFVAITLLIVGWRVGAPYGWGWGILGAAVGLVLSVPAVGSLGLALMGIAYITGGLGERK